jgi:hypothetical protein
MRHVFGLKITGHERAANPADRIVLHPLGNEWHPFWSMQRNPYGNLMHGINPLVGGDETKSLFEIIRLAPAVLAVKDI